MKRLADCSHELPIGQRVPANAARVFFALWYLLGSLVHIRFALTNPRVYQQFGTTSLLAGSRTLWTSAVMPHITLFALVLAAFEMTTGVLILSRGKWVKVGLTASVLFNIFLIQLGLGWSGAHGSDFVHNRMPNLLFAVFQFPLFWIRFEKSFPGLLQARPR